MDLMPWDLRIWICDRKPKSGDNAGRLADNYLHYFQSELLAELYQILHIAPLRTSPYHPQTDSLVKRFNKTLKDMLKKAAVEEDRDWDKLLP